MMFRLKLSDPSEITQVNQRMSDGRAVRVPTKTRNVELELIDASFSTLAKHCGKLQEYIQCSTYLQRIQAVNDTVEYLNFSKSDLENLILGFELTKSKRPEWWVRCTSFLNQMNGPEQIEDPIEAK